jgi:hypothetical protein
MWTRSLTNTTELTVARSALNSTEGERNVRREAGKTTSMSLNTRLLSNTLQHASNMNLLAAKYLRLSSKCLHRYFEAKQGGTFSATHLACVLEWIKVPLYRNWSRGLDDRAIEVRSPTGAKDFSSNFCVQTGSGAHPASCPTGTGDKARPGCDPDRSPPSSAEVVNE